MKYLQGHFTLPTCRKDISAEEYAIRVGAVPPPEEKSDVVPPLPSVPSSTEQKDSE
jgi:hypothetical protein